MTQGLETFASGDPLKYAMRGVTELSSQERRSHPTLQTPIKQRYGTDVSKDTARVLEQLNSATDEMELVSAVKTAGLNEVEDYDELLDGVDVNLNSEEPDLGDVMGILDQKLTESLCDREEDAGKASSKSNRESVYVPELINETEGATVYMAKTLSSTAKLRMAWDLDPNNEVVVVDDYEKWERLLGWEKLKQFPHGKNKIREEYGDRLSDEVLKIVAGDAPSGSSDDKSDDTSGPSRGRRTRTKPSEEVLNLARGSRQNERAKLRSKDIADSFEDGDTIGYKIDTLILFPRTCDLNMTDHWWIPGSRGNGKYAAIANCNKGTFEYLNQYEQVWHIEDYLERAGDYEFQTSAGPITMDTASTDNLVVHVLDKENQERMLRSDILQAMPEALHTYVENELYKSIELPHEDDMVYAPINHEDAFWLRPVLREQTNPQEGDALVATGGSSIRDIDNTRSISSDYKLYARARLNEWDFGCPELAALDNASGIYMDLDEGAYEVLETLGRLHDRGEKPFSQSPETRWK